ncbi:MAG: peptide-methionine (S)-S-oxide reductase MsrA [Chthoniobacterales bacterium]
MAQKTTDPPQNTLTLGGGCFWCIEAVFERVEGVTSVVSGYAGGDSPNPTYEQVCSGTTGHAEVTKITYDPKETNDEKLLELFFQIHDPTTLNRQGADSGTQYRSIILYTNEEQKKTAETAKETAQKNFDAPIVTEITALTTFYPAENYHQNFFKNNPGHPYNRAVTRPKVEKAEKILQEAAQKK